MKKIIVCIFVFIFGLGDIMAQEHLTFMGIPIEGKIESFCQKLKAKNFTQLEELPNAISFMGDFTGKQATVFVCATDDGKDVYMVLVFFEPSKEWRTLTSTYTYYKELYTRKYEKPSYVKEKNPALSDSNISLMAEVDKGTVVYNSVWEIKGGDIQLSIEKSGGIYEGLVMIRYCDALNVEAKVKKDLEDI